MAKTKGIDTSKIPQHKAMAMGDMPEASKETKINKKGGGKK